VQIDKGVLTFATSMMNYLAKTPWWLKKIYSSYTWHMNTLEKNIYLTFDDGPHPNATPFVLEELKKHNAQATFFCIGKNVMAHPGVYQQIINNGHTIGNHTFSHVNGWKVNTAIYLNDIKKATTCISSQLFRPPYGRIRKIQAKSLPSVIPNCNIIMWSVLSGDFDSTIAPQKCVENVVRNSREGSIIVFHDSEKAFQNLSYALPKVLDYFSKEGYSFKAI
jgi:peptidoglycan/xylan/chitin deacetylase (PgdA/CDA1 family)